jgi:hypothetical protein
MNIFEYCKLKREFEGVIKYLTEKKYLRKTELITLLKNEYETLVKNAKEKFKGGIH